MRRRRRQPGISILIWSLVASALLHLAVALPLRRLLASYFAATDVRPEVSVLRLSSEQWSANMQAARQARRGASSAQRVPAAAHAPTREPEKPRPAPEKPPEDKLSGQIVEVPPTPDDSPNPSAKYLSKYNSHVEKESVARPEDRNPALGRVTNKLESKSQTPPTPGALLAPGLTSRSESATSDPVEIARADRGKGSKQFVLELPDLVRRDRIDLAPSDGPGRSLARREATDEHRGNSDRMRIEIGDADADGKEQGDVEKRDGTKGGDNALPTISSLLPTFGTVARMSGSPSRDHVEGVPEGEGTFLNTKEFKYATFFYRVRDSVASYWEGLVIDEHRRRDPTGNIYGVRDRSTLLQIRLSREGRLEDVRVEGKSGVPFLDDVAVRAFQMAEPFPNPPPGIADADGTIRFNFMFVLTMRASGPFGF